MLKMSLWKLSIFSQSRACGSNRISNLTLACRPCNEAKGNQDIKDFLSGKPNLAIRILSKAKAPLKDAAAINATRWKLFETLIATGLPITTGSGALTKYNRCRLDLPCITLDRCGLCR